MLMQVDDPVEAIGSGSARCLWPAWPPGWPLLSGSRADLQADLLSGSRDDLKLPCSALATLLRFVVGGVHLEGFAAGVQ